MITLGPTKLLPFPDFCGPFLSWHRKLYSVCYMCLLSQHKPNNRVWPWCHTHTHSSSLDLNYLHTYYTYSMEMYPCECGAKCSTAHTCGQSCLEHVRKGMPTPWVLPVSTFWLLDRLFTGFTTAQLSWQGVSCFHLPWALIKACFRK